MSGNLKKNEGFRLHHEVGSSILYRNFLNLCEIYSKQRSIFMVERDCASENQYKTRNERIELI